MLMGYDSIYKVNKQIISASFVVLSIVRAFNYLVNRKIRRRNKNMLSKKTSNKVAVIGLGPSVKTLDFDSLDCDTIVVNRFSNFYEQSHFTKQPTFVCFADNVFYDKELPCIEKSISMFEKSSFVLNGKYIKKVKKYANLKNVFFGFFQKAYCNPNKEINFCKRIPANMNSIGLAIEIALFLKYETIEIYGMDFTNLSAKQVTHCYSEAEKQLNPPFKKLYYNYSIAFEQFDCYNQYAKKRNIKIINKSKESLVDTFDFQE